MKIILKFLALFISTFCFTGFMIFSSNISLKDPMFSKDTLIQMELLILGIWLLQFYFHNEKIK